MRALLISVEFPPGPGGIGHHAFQISKDLKQRGIHLKIVTFQNNAGYQEVQAFNQETDLDIIKFKRTKNAIYDAFRRFSLLRKVIRLFGPEVVMASGSSSLWLASFLKLFFKYQYIPIIHGGELTNRSAIRKFLTNLSCGNANRIICVSNYTSRYLRKFKNNIEVVHNGADKEKFYPLSEHVKSRFRSDLGLNRKTIILTVGSVTDRKAQDTVVKSLPDILKQFPDVVYVMVGYARDAEKILELAKRLKVNDNIRIEGIVTDEALNYYYNIAELYVLVSRHARNGDFEGFGISVIEAALCKLPAVVSKNCGLEEAVIENETGLLVEEDDSESTAREIINLLADVNRRESYGENAYHRALHKLTWEKVGERYFKIIGQ